MTDRHAVEHDFDDVYLADTLVVLGDREVIVTPLCRACGEPVPCRGGDEPEPESARRRRKTSYGWQVTDR